VLGNGIIHQQGIVGAKPLPETGGDFGRQGRLMHGAVPDNLGPPEFVGRLLLGLGQWRQHVLSSEQIEDDPLVDELRRPAINL